MENEEKLLEENNIDYIGSKDEEFADPQDTDKEEGENDEDNPEPQKQSSEENAKYAAARRDAEKKQQEAEAKLLKNAKALGYDSVEEWDAAIEDFEKEKLETEKAERIEKFGYDPDELINKAVEEKLKTDPRFIEMENSKKSAKATEAINILNKEFNLGIKSETELDSIDNADKVAKLVSAGFDIVEAYKMANYDTLTQTKDLQKAKDISDSGRADFGGINGTPNPETVTVPRQVAESLRQSGWDDDKILSYYKILQKSQR